MPPVRVYSALRIASYCILSLGVVATLAAMVYAGGSIASLLSGFTVWAVAPYVAFLIAVVIAPTRGAAIAALVFCLAAALFASFIYFDALFVHISSTGALVFVFIPLYQLLTAAIIIVLCIERRVHATRNT